MRVNLTVDGIVRVWETRLLFNHQQDDLYVLCPGSLPLGHIWDTGVTGEAGGPCARGPASLGPPLVKCFKTPFPFQLEVFTFC